MAGLSCEGLVKTEADWMQFAACKGVSTEVFFVEKGARAYQALSYCDRCTVRDECLEYAVENGISQGIWGGRSPLKRRGNTFAYTDKYLSQTARLRIALLSTRGWTADEIAREFDCSRRTVQRILAAERAR